MTLANDRPMGGRRLSGSGADQGEAVPLISIVTVCREAGEHLESCLASVRGQSFRDFEHLVIDGASTDGTVDILRRHEGEIDLWVSEPDEGLYDAMNKGVGLARGRWLYFLGADDILLDCLGEVAPHLRDERTVYHGDWLLMRSRRRRGGEFGAFRLSGTNISQQAIFYPRTVFKRRKFDGRYPIQADWEFNMWCFSRPEFSFRHIQVLVCEFNDRQGLSSRFMDGPFQEDYLGMVRKYFPPPIYAWRLLLVSLSRLYRRVVPLDATVLGGGSRT